ncbi:hypothetical protein Huta_1106 [Halorhabdus utahensis DSM 12940]|uniref:Uncharacterized protein n=1 Tax=Halorhabdus utahensis (strain DSM 12940 / JCM 11049 / AX-2) TaxID=519442 RepID=C7NM77_HALUD|nr:hypothetical protein Huta_1106 [Halorhabdus utahensis DSM 12940]
MGSSGSYVRRCWLERRSILAVPKVPIERIGTKTYITSHSDRRPVRQWQRGLLVIGLAGLLLGMGVHYGAVEEDHWPYPEADEIAGQPAEHIGEELFLFGTVTAVDADAETATIRVAASPESISITVQSFDRAAQSGGTVQVLGELTDERTVDADRVVVVNDSGGAEWYKYGVSVIGAIVVLIAFFRYWRIDTDSWSFGVRHDG